MEKTIKNKKKKAAKTSLNSFLNLKGKKKITKIQSEQTELNPKILKNEILNNKLNSDSNIKVPKVHIGEDYSQKIENTLLNTERLQKSIILNSKDPTVFKEKYPYLLLSSSYNGETNKVRLSFYDEQENYIINLDDPTNHKPFFYVKLSEQASWNILKLSPEYSKIKHMIYSIEKKSLTDRLFLKTEFFSKISTKTPSDVPKIRKIFRENDIITYESDIRYHINYLYDRNLITGMYYELLNGRLIKSSQKITKSSKIPETKYEEEILNHFKSNSRYSDIIDDFVILFTENIPSVEFYAFDIEIQVPKNVFPKVSAASYPISCIAIVNSLNEQFVFYLDREKGSTNLEDLRHGNLPVNTKIFAFRSEKELLLSFNEFIGNISLLLTYNGNEFDIPYLINRCSRLKIKIDNMKYDKRFKVSKLKNGIHLDLYNWFSNPAIRLYAYSGAYKDLKLGTVASSILGKTKYDYEGELWNLSGKELIYYNVIDSQITLELLINNDYSNFKLILLLSRITHVPIDELVSKKVSSWLQYFFQFEHRKRNYLIPNSSEIRSLKGSQATSQAIIKDKKFQGAIVIEPKKGIHFDVTVLDFASLYPSIISSRNLSYETILCGHEECFQNRVPGTNYYTCLLENGIISQLVGFLKDIRIDWFKKLSKSNEHPNAEFYSIIEKSLKVLINAAYGVLGAEFFSFYCLPVAEATTAVGRHLIEKTIEKCVSLEVDVLYGDTDSVFLKTPPSTVINTIIEWSEKVLGIPLEIDKEYKFIILTERKKNYLGVLKNGSLDIKGLLGKKSNIPKCVKDSFDESTRILQNEIQSPDDFESSKEKIKKVITTLYERLEKSKRLGKNKHGFTAEELAFSIQLTKFTHQYEQNVQHVRAARIYESYMRKQGNSGYRLQPGSIINFIKGKNDVIPIELVKDGFIVDVNSYKSQVESTFLQILESLGIDIGTLQNKVNLFDFIS